MTKKVKTEREKPASYVSIKHESTGIHAQFIRYADRAVVCKLHIRRKDNTHPFWTRWAINNKTQGKARCNPGDPITKLGGDVFDETVGMDISYLRTHKAFEEEVEMLKLQIEESRKEMEMSQNVMNELTRAMELFDREYVKFRDQKLLVCEQKFE